MKSLTTTLILTSFVVSLFATSRCERLADYDMGNLHYSFTRDLLSHVWKTGMLGEMSSLYFQEDGLVLAKPVGTERVDSYLWSLAVNAGEASLTVFSPTEEKKFVISPTCNGISAALHGKSTPMLISDDVLIQEVELDFLSTQLTGTWQYRTERSGKTAPSGFSMSLKSDGTFRLNTGPDIYHNVQDGVWQISPDGQYLILSTQMYVGENLKYVAETLRLKSVDFEDMVIDAEHLPRFLQEYSGKRLLYLARARA
jgi:hypothetical protein